MKGRMVEWLDGWMDECVEEPMDARLDGWISGWVEGCMVAWVPLRRHGCVGRGMNGRASARANKEVES